MREPQKSYVPKESDKDIHFNTTTPFVSSTTIETSTDEVNKRLKSYKFNNIDEVYESILNEDNTTSNTNFQ